MVGCPLIATDGFEYYIGAVGDLVGSACVYGQVVKTRRNNRVIRVERRLKIGTASRLKAALCESEDSETLNTSFIERCLLRSLLIGRRKCPRPRVLPWSVRGLHSSDEDGRQPGMRQAWV